MNDTRYYIIGALFCALAQTAAAEDFQLSLPVACDVGRTCFIQNYVDADPSSTSADYRCGTLTYDGHSGTDFRLPSMKSQREGIDVLAAADGRVLRVRDEIADISVKETNRESTTGLECGNGVVISHSGGWETQYCHMARHSLQVRPGQFVKIGQPLGRIGLSGLTEYPHLHFTVRHEGKITDPFAYGAAAGRCGGGEMLWEPSLRDKLTYRERTVLNAGFAAGAITMKAIEEGEADGNPPAADASALVAFVRAIGLKAGDVQLLLLRSPSGKEIARHRLAPLDKNKAQTMLFTGTRRPPSGWDRGMYQATYIVEHDGRIVLQRNLQLDR
jgi:murein DD-endopeptidase MepM/ murein hydrolase activator NlpD